MRRAALLLAGLLALGPAACGDDPAPDEASTAAPAPVGAAGDLPPLGDDVIVVSPRPGTIDPRPAPFTRALPAGGVDGLELRIEFLKGPAPCTVLDTVAVTYAEQLTVTVFVGTDPAAKDIACPDVLRDHAVTIRLEEPVAGRTIVDGAAAAVG